MKAPGYTAETAAARLSARLGGGMRASRQGYMVRCPAHADKGPSLSVRPVADGEFMVRCFAGCDDASLVRAVHRELNLNNREVAEALEHGPNAPAPTAADRYTVRSSFPPGFRPGPGAFDHYLHGSPTTVWPYILPTGCVAAFVARYDTTEGKEFIPHSWGLDNRSGKQRMVHRAPSPRPLFNLQEVVANPHLPILWSEGEKAATAAARLFPEFVATTSMNGVNSVHLTDFSPCQGREFIVSPDNDSAGLLAANVACKRALAHGASDVLVLMPPANFNVVNDVLVAGETVAETGDDLADHEARGWTGSLWRKAQSQSGLALLRRLILPIADINS